MKSMFLTKYEKNSVYFQFKAFNAVLE